MYNVKANRHMYNVKAKPPRVSVAESVESIQKVIKVVDS
jgi:hypothetical protein